jgi:hypothetical protein
VKKSNEAVVHLQPSAQHTWSQLSACLSYIFCPFCISSHPQLGQENRSFWGSGEEPSETMGQKNLFF